jgi:RNA polymerase primary sigma factor
MHTQLLTHQEEQALAQRIAAGDEQSVETLILHNLRLPILIATRDFPWYRDRDDLIAVGTLGLVEAARKFEPGRAAFCHHALFHIRKRVYAEITTQHRVVRLSYGLRDRLSRIHAAAAKHPLGEPSVEWLASETNLEPIQIRRALAAYEQECAPLDDAHELPASTPHPADVLADREDIRDLLRYVADLPPVQKTILERRFGLDGQDPEFLREIGTRLGISGERARQLEATALATLKRRVRARETSCALV